MFPVVNMPVSTSYFKRATVVEQCYIINNIVILAEQHYNVDNIVRAGQHNLVYAGQYTKLLTLFMLANLTLFMFVSLTLFMLARSTLFMLVSLTLFKPV